MDFVESVLAREGNSGISSGADYDTFALIASNVRAKFDALPSPEVSSANIRAIREASTVQGSKSFVSNIIDFFRQKNLFGKYLNNDTGWDDISIGSSTVKSIVHHGGRDGKIALIEIVPDLIRGGILLETNPKNASGLISHVFAAKATIDGEPYAVTFVVREDYNGRRYYDHSLTKTEALDRITDQAPAVDGGKNPKAPAQNFRDGETPANENSTINILKKYLAVNNQILINSETEMPAN